MTNDEAKSKQEETLNNLKKYNKTRKTEVVDDIEGNRRASQYRALAESAIDIEDDDDLNTVLDTLRKARKHVAKTHHSQETTWTKEEIEAARLISLVEDDAEVVAEPIMSHLCPYCGTMAYMGQIHGMGYCKEKVQYEQ